jgi:hypothetical protein
MVKGFKVTNIASEQGRRMIEYQIYRQLTKVGSLLQVASECNPKDIQQRIGISSKSCGGDVETKC